MIAWPFLETPYVLSDICRDFAQLVPNFADDLRCVWHATAIREGELIPAILKSNIDLDYFIVQSAH